MQKRFGTILDIQGRPVERATVQVNLYPGGGAATIYSDDGVTQIANPVTTSPLGYYEYYAANGHYSETITTNSSSRTVNDILLADSLTTNQQFIAATGTGNALVVAAFATGYTLADGDEIRVRSPGANTVRNPTISLPGVGVLTIYRGGGKPLGVYDIIGSGHELHLRYRAAPARAELVNPVGRNERINVRLHFGAAGDNATDDKAAIQAAVDAADALADNCAVYFPAGIYRISGSLTFRRGVNWYGDGVEATQITAGGYPSASGLPMVEMTTCPDWRIEGIRFEGQNKAAGLKATNSYFGRAEQCHFNAMTGYGLWLIESALTVFSRCSFYYYTNAADIVALAEGGSLIELVNCILDARCVGIKGSANGLGSGVRAIRCSFGSHYPCLKIPTGDSLWEVDGCFFEGTVVAPASDIISVGTYAGGGGVTPRNLVFSNNQIAGTNNNAVDFGTLNSLLMFGNEFGKNVTVSGGVSRLYEFGNFYVNGATLTDQSQISHRTNGAVRSLMTAGADHSLNESSDATFGAFTQSLNRAEAAYKVMTWAASNFDWLVSGDTNNKMSLDTVGNLRLPRKLYPGTPANAQQTAAGVYGGTGAPSNANGSDGDFYFRGDGTVAGNTVVYHKQAGAWVTLVTA